jgi:hypothetical protein
MSSQDNREQQKETGASTMHKDDGRVVRPREEWNASARGEHELDRDRPLDRSVLKGRY